MILLYKLQKLILTTSSLVRLSEKRRGRSNVKKHRITVEMVICILLTLVALSIINIMMHIHVVHTVLVLKTKTLQFLSNELCITRSQLELADL